MSWRKKGILAAVFAIFFIAGYLFILLNNLVLDYASIAAGLLSIPLAILFFKEEMANDFRSSLLFLAVLISAFFVLIFFFFTTDQKWAVLIPSIFIAPVLIEEFNFRYLLQRIFFRSTPPYLAVVFQALFYVLYYSKYVVAGGGVGFPFPYNLLMITSVLAMGLIYGLLSKLTRNFLLSTTLHLTIWSLFPILALYPGIASTLFPT